MSSKRSVLSTLVVLNIGYDRGIISGPLFAIFVLMAMITTMMTGPLMNLLGKGRHGAEAPPLPAHP